MGLKFAFKLHMLTEYSYVQNDLAPSAQLTVVVYPEIKREKKQPGKWLEWVHIKITGGQKDCKLRCASIYKRGQ
jgi:hypothetical protein